PDDAGMLGLGAHHEPGDVLDEEDRRVVAAHRLDEVRDLARALRVDDAPEAGRPGLPARGLRALEHATRVRDDPDRHAVDEAGPADHLIRVLRLELLDAVAVEDAIQDVP